MPNPRPRRATPPTLLAAAAVLSAAAPAAQRTAEDPLAESFDAFFASFERGRLGDERRHWQVRRPHLHPTLRRARSAYAGVYTRLEEAEELFDLLAERGRLEDGRRLVRVLRTRWPERADADLLASIKSAAREAIAGRDCALPVQAAVVDALRDGLRVVSPPGRPKACAHDDPTLAAALMPLLASFHPTRFRARIEAFARGRQPRLICAAARALRGMGSARSVSALAAALGRLDDAGDVELVAQAMLALLDGDDRASDDARAADDDAIVDAALAKLRASDDLKVKEAIAPVLLRVRAARTIPALLDELDHAAELRAARTSPTGLPFWTATLHELLRDLTGYAAPADRPGEWRAFWERARDGFQLPPPKPRDASRTVARRFFGIPVRGERVLFVLDTSGSMSATSPSADPTDVVLTRLERAKRELLAAVDGLPPTATFAVILFSTKARVWERRAATPGARASLAAYLRGVEPRGGTRLLRALHVGLAGKIRVEQSRGRPSIDEVFVLSDGAPASDPARILAEVGDWNVGRAARIHAVFLGKKPDADVVVRPPEGPARLDPPAFMERLARENGGLFRQVE